MDHARTWNDETAARPRYDAGLAWIATLAVAATWWAVIWRQAVEVGADIAGPEGPPIPIPLIITITVFGRMFALAFEALFYWAWWRSSVAPFRYQRFFHSLALISLVDALAATLRAVLRDVGHDGRLWLAPVLGIDLLREGPPGSTPTVWIAFGTVGVATAVRLVLTIAAQRRETGRSAVAVAALTLAVWSITRMLTWWSLDLARGMSPLP